MELQPQRIAVDSEQDWLRVRSNVEKAVAAAVAIRFGETGEGDEALRKEVDGRVKKILDNMFEMAIPNIKVNGVNYEDYLGVTEPFNIPLDTTSHALRRQMAEWRTRLAEFRRIEPERVEVLNKGVMGMWDKDSWKPAPVETEAEDGMDVDVPLMRHDQTVQTFRQTLENLSELSKTAPSQLARADRVKSVKEHVQAMSSA